MRKSLLFVAGLVLASSPQMLAAKDRVDPRVQDLMDCRTLAPDAERLACYDRAMASVQQALSKGTLELNKKRGPVALEGVIKQSGVRGENKFWVVLDNGDRWDLLPNDTRNSPPTPGSTLKIRRAFMGNYWASGTGWDESEADFIPNKS